jgi:hypothetical protein
MPMVTLASLVVVSHHAIATNHVRQPVFEAVLTAFQWAIQSPHNQLYEDLFLKNQALVQQRRCSHVVKDANIRLCCQ